MSAKRGDTPARRRDTPARQDNTAATRRHPGQIGPAAADSGLKPRARLPPAALVVYRNHNI